MSEVGIAIQKKNIKVKEEAIKLVERFSTILAIRPKNGEKNLSQKNLIFFANKKLPGKAKCNLCMNPSRNIKIAVFISQNNGIVSLLRTDAQRQEHKDKWSKTKCFLLLY